MRQKAKAEAQTRRAKAGRVPTPPRPERQPAPRHIAGSTPASPGNQSINPIKERPRRSFAPKEKPTGGSFIPKTRQTAAASKSTAKAASAAAKKKTAARPLELAKRRVQRNAQRKLLQQSGSRAKTALDLSRKAAVVTAKAVSSLISAIAGLLGGAFLIPIICLIVLVAAIIASPFGILFANEPTPGAMPLNVAVGQLNMELANTLETMQTGDYDSIMYGELMEATGGLSALLTRMVKRTGANGSIVAVFIFGYVLSIPVGFPAAMAVGCPMLKPLSRKTGKPLVSFASAFIPASFTTSSLVIPTLTPVLVCGLVGANLGWSFVYSLVASLAAALVGCLVWAFAMAKVYGKIEKAEDFDGELVDVAEPDNAPPTSLIVGLIILPIALILAGTILPQMLPADNPIVTLFNFIGNTSFALILSIMVELVVLRKYLDNTMKVVETAVSKCGMNLVLTGLSGAMGAILMAVGVGDMLLRYTENINLPVLALAFLITLLIRVSTGVTTVAATTVAPLLLPMVTSLGVSPVLYALAICFGCVGPALPNDGAFWMYKNFAGMTTKETFLSFTIPTTIIGILGLIAIMVLNTLAPVLPGLL